MLLADVASFNFDWTALAVAALTAIGTVCAYLLKRSFGKLDRHMERVEKFIEDSGKTDVATALELKHHKEKFAHHQRWLETHEQRLNDPRIMQETHSMIREMHAQGCGVQQDIERERRAG